MSEETKNDQQIADTQESTEKSGGQNHTAETVSLKSFVGIKEGMTRIFDANGNQIPVTVVKLISNVITQVKTVENDGYAAYQVGYHTKRENLVKKPVKGHLKKANTEENLTRFQEVRVDEVKAGAIGTDVSLSEFTPDTFIDVRGTSKGKGFQGVVKKYGFSIGPKSHGSGFHRTGGSIGQCATPGKVFKGKKMPGQMGNKRKTVQNLKVVELNQDKGYMLIRGSVPGSKNGFITISKSIKKA